MRQKKQDGYEAIKITEFLAPDLIPAVTDEAHKLGMGVTGHTWDSITFAKAGVDAVEHIWSVGYTSIRDPEKRNKLAYERTKGRIDAEVAGAQYEVEGFDDVIKALVENKVAFTPTIAKWMRPLSPSAERFWKREQEILGNPKASFPTPCGPSPNTPLTSCSSATSPSDLAATKAGFAKANEFIRRFVAAGGILKEGSDSGRGMAAMLVHEALTMDVEAGVPPMIAIQAATINVAKVFHKDKDYGSVEVGKVADLSIIEGDPLQDIWMTQNVKLVVLDGKIVDPAYTGFVNPIPEFNSYQQLSINIAVTPYSITQDTGPTTIKVSGRGFWPFHQVLLNGKEIETKFINRGELQAVVPADLVKDVGMYKVTVKSRGETVAELSPAPLVVGYKH